MKFVPFVYHAITLCPAFKPSPIPRSTGGVVGNLNHLTHRHLMQQNVA